MVASYSGRLTVNVKSVIPSTPVFCTIMSTSIFLAPTGPKILEAIPGKSGTPETVIFASSTACAMPDTSACSIVSFSNVINVPGPSTKVDITRKGTRYRPANSTERGCNTLEPRLASSNISSKVICCRRRAPSTILGSVVYTPSTSVQISHSSASRAAAKATAEVSEPPRPKVVISPRSFTP